MHLHVYIYIYLYVYLYMYACTYSHSKICKLVGVFTILLASVQGGPKKSAPLRIFADISAKSKNF